jgi:hypothetical protein
MYAAATRLTPTARVANRGVGLLRNAVQFAGATRSDTVRDVGSLAPHVSTDVVINFAEPFPVVGGTRGFVGDALVQAPWPSASSAWARATRAENAETGAAASSASARATRAETGADASIASARATRAETGDAASSASAKATRAETGDAASSASARATRAETGADASSASARATRAEAGAAASSAPRAETAGCCR